VLLANGLCKRYGSLAALDGVSIAFHGGEVHVILGENGAGKSTLVSILCGAIQPDAGTLGIDGTPARFRDPFDARRAGVDIVHQHFMLVPAFTVAENLALASGVPGWMLDVNAGARPAIEIAERLGWHTQASARTGSLGVGEQQRVEIAKALAGGGRVVLFDEPTSTLSPGEIEELFSIIRKLRDEGRAIALITHKLDEAIAVADRITVLRKGRAVATTPSGEVSRDQLAHWMVGEVPAALSKPPPESREPVVTAEGLVVLGDAGHRAVNGATFGIGKGEVLGFGGVDGNGQLELAEALAGVRQFRGSLRVPSRTAYIPQDRQRDGLALEMSVAENLLIGGHRNRELRRGPVFDPARVEDWCESLVARYAIKSDSLSVAAGSLSGGNQQKIVVARALESHPELLVASNPTRGLDIRAENYVHSVLLEAKKRGTAIALFSTDLEELALLSDRVVFMSRGELLEGTDVGQMLGGAK
jgi:ABC-type uncharacterized transport system ATPase subunit